MKSNRARLARKSQGFDSWASLRVRVELAVSMAWLSVLCALVACGTSAWAAWFVTWRGSK